MAQHDYVIDNQSFPATRTDINNVLLAISSTNSGTSAPSTTYANQLWYDTTNNKLYIRNEDNDAWIPLFLLDQSNDVAGTLATEIDVEDASGTDTAGTALTIKGGAGTGAGAGGSIVFQTADGGASGSSVNAHATVVTITDDGDVGIGVASPAQKLHLQGGGTTYMRSENTGISTVTDFGTDSTGSIIINRSAKPMRFFTNSLERMRITTSGTLGRLLINTTTDTSGFIHIDTDSTYDATAMRFKQDGATVGSITCTSSATSFNTSSDYRLKENVTDITDGITRVKQLDPKRFNFVVEPDTTVDGFLAHEVADVVPEAIQGEKDATEPIGNVTDADGNTTETGVVEPDDLATGHTWTATGTQPVYQGIDQAKLVPLLTAALQEAIAKIEALETRVAALEG